MGAEVIEIPTIEIKPPTSYKALDAALKNIAKYDWLILTSVNGVEALFARLKKLRITPHKVGTSTSGCYWAGDAAGNRKSGDESCRDA